ncbi:LPS assembly lipoprotein LptE [Glaciecola petra]|uniref:LPS-assembly lipoprotein LptE n=1 Tax=Glaciecola petra TaxID=3075602 RepID=A0ABU2ZPF8_9ALTE|nr:LPS assembly lipoprotein LptE [Aestuariibacter sp. P117]MDT0594511.1 LPS assembly lipoprotein LptE [Aestuariibacter sp. P117]
MLAKKLNLFSLGKVSFVRFGDLTLLVVLIFSISACGFQLRGSQALPVNLTQVLIQAPLQYSPLSRALETRLPVYQLNGLIGDINTILPQDMPKTVVLLLQPEQFERRLLSVFTTGQVAEYELVYTIDYQILFPGKQSMSESLTVSREYQDDPDQILAKSRELDLVLEELRNETADRIIRLMSSQYNSSVIDPELQGGIASDAN